MYVFSIFWFNRLRPSFQDYFPDFIESEPGMRKKYGGGKRKYVINGLFITSLEWCCSIPCPLPPCSPSGIQTAKCR